MRGRTLSELKKAAAVAGTIFAAIGVVGSGFPARAQLDNGLPGPQPIDAGSMILNKTLLGIQLDNNLGTSSRSTKKGHRSSASKKMPAMAAASTKYHASPAITRRVEKQYAAWLVHQNPQGAKQIETFFAQHNPVATWSQSVHADGLRPGDVADSFASYWILNWVIANRVDSTRAQALAVREQVRPLIAANPAYARLSEPQRQEIAETMMVNFVVQLLAYQQARKTNDSALLAKLGDAAVTRFHNEMGLDLRALALTDKGFRKK